MTFRCSNYFIHLLQLGLCAFHSAISLYSLNLLSLGKVYSFYDTRPSPLGAILMEYRLPNAPIFQQLVLHFLTVAVSISGT